jgi:hypothetical protein
MVTDEPIEREVLRGAMLESLREQAPSQYVNFQHNVAGVLAKRGLPVDGGVSGREPALRRIDERRFREIVWQLINQNVLVQGTDANNAQWPWLSLSEWGEEYVQAGGPDVYDPDGYLRDLANDRPLDDIEQRYLSQASAAFRADLPDAAAVMVGGASEHLLILLADAIVASDETGGATKVEKMRDGPALKLLNEVRKYLEPRRKNLDRSLAESFETTFLGVANMIRTSRNEAGHPALSHVDRDQAFVALRLFPLYRRWVYAVIDALPI